MEEIIGPALIKRQFDVGNNLAGIDRFMIQLDGTKNKTKLGANAMLGVSMACARAGAAAKVILFNFCSFLIRTTRGLLCGRQRMPLYAFLRAEAGITGPYVLPVPFFNVLNGGKHSGNTMAFQEFMIAPVGAESLTQAVQLGSEVYQALKSVITEKHGAYGRALFTY